MSKTVDKMFVQPISSIVESEEHYTYLVKVFTKSGGDTIIMDHLLRYIRRYNACVTTHMELVADNRHVEATNEKLEASHIHAEAQGYILALADVYERNDIIFRSLHSLKNAFEDAVINFFEATEQT